VNVTPIDDATCFAFERVDKPGAAELLRFVVGEDPGPRPMTGEDIDAELGDPFAALLLRNGRFPGTAEDVVAAITEAAPESDPLSAKPMTFLLGEGSQLPGGPDAPGTNRGMRFLVACGRAPDIDLLISAASPTEGLVEVMAWDRKAGGFNYYRTVGDAPSWAFAGNSRHALKPPTAGKGPFESHPSGSLLMKELKFPWLHWHSPAANIFEPAFDPGDDRAAHPWFNDKLGADVLELSVAIPSIDRWTAKRFEELNAADGSFADPRRVVEQVVATPTVNLVTSRQTSLAVTPGSAVDLPTTFFADVDALASQQLGLAAPGEFSVSGEHYLAALEEFESALVERPTGFRHPRDPAKFADTHFAFAVPERAFEDQSALRAAIAAGLITPRLAAALLMVDFPNPVFSARRAQLLAHAPQNAPNAAAYSDQFADAILAAADGTADGSTEKEFVERWSVGPDFRAPFDALLTAYYDVVRKRLATREGYFDIVRLAESRRRRVRALPIGGEFDLLFATLRDDTAPRPLRMTAQATIEEES
jgi:hypothetical protein